MSARIQVALVCAAIALAAAGCPEKKGPAQRAGEKVDRAVEGAGDAVEDAGDEIEDAVD